MQKEGVFCYYHLHNATHGKSKIERMDDKIVQVSLPGSMRVYGLGVDVRDPRVLVCFDGDIPSGGLPKGSTVVGSFFRDAVFCHRAGVYKQRSEHEDCPGYLLAGDSASMNIYRRFVLLKTGRAIFRKYTESLQPKYLIVDVHNGVAEFSTSSY